MPGRAEGESPIGHQSGIANDEAIRGCAGRRRRVPQVTLWAAGAGRAAVAPTAGVEESPGSAGQGAR